MRQSYWGYSRASRDTCFALATTIGILAGATVISGGYDQVVRLWNASTLLPILQPNGDLNAFKMWSTQPITSLAYSTNGATILTASRDKWIRAYTLQG